MKRLLSVFLALSLMFTVFGAFAEEPGSMPPGDPPGGFGNGNPPGEPPEGFDGGNPPGDPPDGVSGATPPDGQPGGGFGGGTPPGGSAADITYTAATEINAESTLLTRIDETYASDTADDVHVRD